MQEQPSKMAVQGFHLSEKQRTGCPFEIQSLRTLNAREFRTDIPYCPWSLVEFMALQNRD